MRFKKRWVVIGGALSLLLALAVLWSQNGPPDVRISWRYTPSVQNKSRYRLYLRPQGGCYAVSDRGLITILSENGQLIKEIIPKTPGFWQAGVQDELGNLYLPQMEKSINAFNPQGQQLWSRDLKQLIFQQHPGANVDIAIAFGDDDKIYGATHTGELIIFSLDGQVEHCYKVSEELEYGVAPTLAPDGGVYLVGVRKDPQYQNPKNELIQVSAKGEILWRRFAEDPLIRNVKVSRDGKLYCYSSGYYGVTDHYSVYVYDSDNNIRFSYTDPDPLLNGNSRRYRTYIQNDGTIVIVSNSRITVFDNDGKILWSRHFPGSCSIVAINQEFIYVQETKHLKARIDGWYSRLSRRWKSALAIKRGGYSRELYILDNSNGKTKKLYNLGSDVIVGCGPGVNGELYGYHVEFLQQSYGYDVELLRINLPE